VTTYTWDSYSVFNEILDNPTEYGFKDATTVNNNEEDVFWG
jgi:phospholipase/lecithinase/hemolysin